MTIAKASLTVMTIFCLLQLPRDDWKTKEIFYPPDVVFPATERAVARYYKIDSSDSLRHMIRFKIESAPMTAGYSVTLTVDGSGAGKSKVVAYIEKKGGIVSLGDGKAEILKIYRAIDVEVVRMNQ